MTNRWIRVDDRWSMIVSIVWVMSSKLVPSPILSFSPISARKFQRTRPSITADPKSWKRENLTEIKNCVSSKVVDWVTCYCRLFREGRIVSVITLNFTSFDTNGRSGRERTIIEVSFIGRIIKKSLIVSFCPLYREPVLMLRSYGNPHWYIVSVQN